MAVDLKRSRKDRTQFLSLQPGSRFFAVALPNTAKWDKRETAKRGERMWLKIHQGRESVVEVVNT